MQNSNFFVTQKKIYSLIKRDWHISVVNRNLLKVKLSEFGLSTIDINLMLNSIEWKYNVKIEMETVLPQVTLDGFIKEIASAAALP